jgi:hypothetical protein
MESDNFPCGWRRSVSLKRRRVLNNWHGYQPENSSYNFVPVKTWRHMGLLHGTSHVHEHFLPTTPHICPSITLSTNPLSKHPETRRSPPPLLALTSRMKHEFYWTRSLSQDLPSAINEWLPRIRGCAFIYREHIMKPRAMLRASLNPLRPHTSRSLTEAPTPTTKISFGSRSIQNSPSQGTPKYSPQILRARARVCVCVCARARADRWCHWNFSLT